MPGQSSYSPEQFTNSDVMKFFSMGADTLPMDRYDEIRTIACSEELNPYGMVSELTDLCITETQEQLERLAQTIRRQRAEKFLHIAPPIIEGTARRFGIFNWTGVFRRLRKSC